MECIHPDFGENWGGLGNKKATASVGLAVALTYFLFNLFSIAV